MNSLIREGRWDSIVGPNDFRELGTGGVDIPDGRCKMCGNFGPVRNGSEGDGFPVLLLHKTRMTHFRDDCKYCHLMRAIVLAFAPSEGQPLGVGINLELPEDRPALLNFRGKEEVVPGQRQILRSVVIYTDTKVSITASMTTQGVAALESTIANRQAFSVGTFQLSALSRTFLATQGLLAVSVS